MGNTHHPVPTRNRRQIQRSDRDRNVRVSDPSRRANLYRDFQRRGGRSARSLRVAEVFAMDGRPNPWRYQCAQCWKLLLDWVVHHIPVAWMMVSQMRRTETLRRQSSKHHLRSAIPRSRLRRRGCRLRLQRVRQPKDHRQNRRRGTHYPNLPRGNLHLQNHLRGNHLRRILRLLRHREPRPAESLLQIEVS
jgi:hypothetical protein